MSRLPFIAGLVAMFAVGASMVPELEARSLVIVEFTSELTLANVDFPVTDSGSVSFRACADCASYSMPVTADTEYLAAGDHLTRAEFLARVTELRLTQTGNLTTMVALTYRAEGRTVTRISLLADALSAN